MNIEPDEITDSTGAPTMVGQQWYEADRRCISPMDEIFTSGEHVIHLFEPEELWECYRYMTEGRLIIYMDSSNTPADHWPKERLRPDRRWIQMITAGEEFQPCLMDDNRLILLIESRLLANDVLSDSDLDLDFRLRAFQVPRIITSRYIRYLHSSIWNSTPHKALESSNLASLRESGRVLGVLRLQLIETVKHAAIERASRRWPRLPRRNPGASNSMHVR